MELTDKQKELFASYRIGSTQYVLAGEKDGCFKLANDYDLMEQMEETAYFVFASGDLEESRDKLGCFLCFYMNGPHLYQEKYGNIQLGAAHAHIPIGSKNEMLGYPWLCTTNATMGKTLKILCLCASNSSSSNSEPT